MGGLWILDLLTITISVAGIFVCVFKYKKGGIDKTELVCGIGVFLLFLITCVRGLIVLI